MESLNTKQYEAATYGEGPLLILAGAGSGKTRVLVFRVAYLIREKNVKPWNILAVTFTNKAAGEMKERVVGLLGNEGKNVDMGTFHHICARILRRHIDRLGYKTNFVIYDDRDQLSAIKTILEREGIDDKSVPPKKIQAIINTAKNQSISPVQSARNSMGFFKEKMILVIEEYEKLLRQGNALDFGDLIYLTVELFKENEDLLEEYRKRWSFILVDEYQDTNPVQYQLIKMLAGGLMNITVVGDDDQSIYRWRGADISNILDFERDFPGAHIVRLEQNYRSTQRILSAAGSVVEKNVGRKGKDLWTEVGEGELLTLCQTSNEYEEARYVLDEIGSIHGSDDRRYSDFAIFYRTNAQSRVVEEELLKRAIPYTVVGGMKFYDRMEIKDILCYLRVIINPDDTVALKRVINTPPRGIGKKSIADMEEKAIDMGASLYRAIELEKGNKKIIAFRSMIESLCAKKETLDTADLLREVLIQSGYVKKLKDENTVEARSRLENIEELEEAIREMIGEGEESSIESFLERTSLMSDVDNYSEKEERVTLMTLHSAKGLEFPAVFMMGMEENLFPHSRSKDDIEALEEERRLCYVGMTRAREHLYLTYTKKRRVFGSEQYNIPSRFLSDIPEELMQRVNIEPAFASAYSGSYGQSGGAHSESYGRKEKVVQAGFVGGGFDDDKGLALDEVGGYARGSKVRHPTFGEGVVRGGEGSGEKAKIAVYFPRLGLKKLLLKYAPLERV
ncbi:MAG: UvrD-helicase domain-containing protein [Proteobacteria bacterium]|nr:UvrD-helicase domain-containing protein [Pseudomonadota bacterium]